MLLNQQVQDAIGRFAEDRALQRRFEKIEQTLRMSVEYFTSFPNRYSITIHEGFKAEHFAPRGRPDLLMAAQLKEISELSGFLILGNVYRLRAVVEDIVEGLNGRRFLMVVGAARSLMENVAVIEHLARRHRKEVDLILALSAKELAAAAKVWKNVRHKLVSPEEAVAHDRVLDGTRKLLGVQTLLRTLIQLRKSNVFDNGRDIPDELRQTNILTLIGNRLRYADEQMTPKISYEALCEFVHPNSSSYGFFVDRVDRTGASSRQLRLSSSPTDWSVYVVVLSLICAPILECLPMCIRTLEAMKLRWNRFEKLEKDFRHYCKV